MLKLIAKRLLLSVPMLLAVVTVTFLLVAVIPGDVARVIVGPESTQEEYESVRRSLGLDQPVLERYADWLGDAARGDLGVSLFLSQQSVVPLLNERLEPTISLVLGATLVATIVGIALGVAGALRAGPIGRAVDALSLVGLAIPNFVLGLVLVAWFAVALSVFPATGYVRFADSPVDWLRGLVLPILTLSSGGIAVVAKQTRDSMLDVLRQPFIRTLRASGVPARSVIFKHALRNAAIPTVTVIGLIIIASLGGAVIVESVFAMPGLGGLAVDATNSHDLPLIQGVVVYFTLVVIAVNLIVDLVYGWLDPRIRVS